MANTTDDVRSQFMAPILEIEEPWPNEWWETIRSAKDGSATFQSAPIVEVNTGHELYQGDIQSLYGDAGIGVSIESKPESLKTLPSYIGEHEAKSETRVVPSQRKAIPKMMDTKSMHEVMSAPIQCTITLFELLKIKPYAWDEMGKHLEKMGLKIPLQELSINGQSSKTPQEDANTKPVSINKVGEYCEGEEGNTTLLVEYKGVKTLAILDSGAGVAIATKDIWEKWDRPTLRKTRMMLQLTDGYTEKPLGPNEGHIGEFKADLNATFKMKDLGLLHHYLGIQFKQCDGGIALCQKSYIETLLCKYGLEDCKPIATPMETGFKLSLHDAGDPADVTLYQTTVGCFIYVCNTRPDIQFAVSQSLPDLHAFLDSDWAGGFDTRVSTSGFCFMLGSSCILWLSKKQPTVATSSCEAEYRAVFTATVECVWLRLLMADLGVGQDIANTIYTDSQSALVVARNLVFHARTKHMEVYYHYVRERLSAGDISLAYVPTQDNLADLFTKALSREKLEAFRKALGLLPFVD
ncbi:hypothetical protein L7F22_018535 [Adiantum nelumboides]|nr:hypothetical protein [Adiantum nelumboides]